MRPRPLARVKGQTFNQDPVSLVHPLQKGRNWVLQLIIPKETGKLYVLAVPVVSKFPSEPPLSWLHCLSGKPLLQQSDGKPGPGLWLAVFINRQEFFGVLVH